jgi:hypothetical protein
MPTPPSTPGGWWKRITQIVRFLSIQEVKTPLSFAFKAAFYLVALWIVVLVWGGRSEAFDKWFVEFTSVIFSLLCAGVLGFAWFNPVNLVYGENAYRAERKLEFGTEHRALSEDEVRSLPKSANQGHPPLPGQD